jgi:hypothetical protein
MHLFYRAPPLLFPAVALVAILLMLTGVLPS